MASLLAVPRVRILAPWQDSGEIVHMSGTIDGVPRPRKIEIRRIPVGMYMYGVKKDCSSILRRL